MAERTRTTTANLKLDSKSHSVRAEKEEASLQSVELSENMFIQKHLRNFLEYDVNGDGVISLQEMKAVLKQSTVGSTERDLRAVLKEVDENEDGSVCFREYLRLAQNLSEKENKTKVKSSRITRAYFDPVQFAQNAQLFQDVADKDGRVNPANLQEFLQQKEIKFSEDRLKTVMKELEEAENGLELDEFMLLLVKALGAKRRKVGPEHCPASQLREEGWAIGELKKVHYDCAALREAGFTPAQLMDVCTAKELLQGGVPVHQLLSAGWDCRLAREAGFKIADLVAAGASVKNLRNAGFTDTASVAALRKLRVEAWKMKLGGFTLSDMRNGGYSSAELRLAGFSSESIAALEKLQNHLKNRSPLNRINTQEIRLEAEMKLQEAHLDGAEKSQEDLQSVEAPREDTTS